MNWLWLDSEARAEWGWKPELDLDAMVDVMIRDLKPKYSAAAGRQ